MSSVTLISNGQIYEDGLGLVLDRYCDTWSLAMWPDGEEIKKFIEWFRPIFLEKNHF